MRTRPCAPPQASAVPRLPRRSVEDGDTSAPGRVPPFVSFPAWEAGGSILEALNFLTWQGADHEVGEYRAWLDIAQSTAIRTRSAQ